MSQLKKLAKQVMTYGASSILARLATFIFLTPYLTRRFSDTEFGLQAELYTWVAFLMIPLTYRMETAFFYFGKEKKNLAKSFRTAMLSLSSSTVLLVSILLLCSSSIANLLEYPEQKYMIVWCILIVGIDALCAIPFALLRLRAKASRFAMLKILNMSIYLGLIFFTLELGPFLASKGWLAAQYWYQPSIGIGYVFWANLIASLVTFILLLPSYFSVGCKQPKHEPFFDYVLWRKMFIYALPLVFAGFAGVMNELLDRTLLKVLLPGTVDERLAEVGIYSACYKIAIFMNLFTQAFNYAAEPFFFKQSNQENSRELFANIAFIFTIVACFAFMSITFFIDLVQYFVGLEFREGIVIVPILLIANMFLGLYHNLAIWFKLSKKTVYGAYIAITGAVVTVVLNVLLIPHLGYLGSAWATLGCYMSMVVLCYYLGQRYYPIPYPMRKILGYFFLAMGFYCIFIPIKAIFPKNIIWGCFIGCFFLLVYALIVFIFDWSKIRRMMKR